MRDRFAPDVFFEERMVEFTKRDQAKTLDYFVDIYNNKDITKTDENGFKALRILMPRAVGAVQVYIPVMYSRGDDIDDIAPFFLETLKRYEFLISEIDKGHPQTTIFGYQGMDFDVEELHSVYTLLAWCLCLGTDAHCLQNIAKRICASGQDRLADVVRGAIIELDEYAQLPAFPRAFGLLDQVIDASPSERESLVKDYLENWYSHIGELEFSSIGYIGSGFKMKSKQALIDGINDHYIGYWAWEAALVVKVFDIDDSSFKDNEFYPVDLVHYGPKLAEIYPNWQPKTDVSEHLKTPEIQKERDDLVVLVSDDPSVPISENKYYIRDVQAEYLYSAYLPKEGADTNSKDFDYVKDSAVRYTVGFLTDKDEIDSYKDDCDYVCSNDDWLVYDRLSLNMIEILDQVNNTEFYPFMDEAMLRVKNDYDDVSLVYCSRHKENNIPPLMVFRFLKFNDTGMLFIECMVRDVTLTYNDVGNHWQWLIDRYQKLA